MHPKTMYEVLGEREEKNKYKKLESLKREYEKLNRQILLIQDMALSDTTKVLAITEIKERIQCIK